MRWRGLCVCREGATKAVIQAASKQNMRPGKQERNRRDGRATKATSKKKRGRGKTLLRPGCVVVPLLRASALGWPVSQAYHKQALLKSALLSFCVRHHHPSSQHKSDRRRTRCHASAAWTAEWVGGPARTGNRDAPKQACTRATGTTHPIIPASLLHLAVQSCLACDHDLAFPPFESTSTLTANEWVALGWVEWPK